MIVQGLSFFLFFMQHFDLVFDDQWFLFDDEVENTGDSSHE